MSFFDVDHSGAEASMARLRTIAPPDPPPPRRWEVVNFVDFQGFEHVGHPNLDHGTLDNLLCCWSCFPESFPTTARANHHHHCRRRETLQMRYPTA